MLILNKNVSGCNENFFLININTMRAYICDRFGIEFK
jgi:hypothetical protein